MTDQSPNPTDTPSIGSVIIESHRRLKIALGDLVMAWSDTENVLVSVLRHYCDIRHEIARILFSGTRASGAMDYLKAVIEIVEIEQSRRTDLLEVFSQILTIETMRNYLIHNIDGSSIEFDDEDPTRRWFSTRRRSNRESKVKIFKIDAPMVESMCADLRECCWRLIAHLEHENSPFERGCGPTGKPQPWRYTPPQPARHHNRPYL